MQMVLQKHNIVPKMFRKLTLHDCKDNKGHVSNHFSLNLSEIGNRFLCWWRSKNVAHQLRLKY